MTNQDSTGTETVREEKPFSELRLFVLFNELDRLIYLLQSRMDGKVIPLSSDKHVQAVLRDLGKRREWALSQLPQFGVEPFKTSGDSVTEEYRAWFRWWKEFFYGLPEEEQLRIMEESFREQETGQDRRPAGTWRDLIIRS